MPSIPTATPDALHSGPLCCDVNRRLLQAKLQDVRLLCEAEAAALAYVAAAQPVFAQQTAGQQRRIAVVDCGAGCTTVSMVELNVEVSTPEGAAVLGCCRECDDVRLLLGPKGCGGGSRGLRGRRHSARWHHARAARWCPSAATTSTEGPPLPHCRLLP